MSSTAARHRGATEMLWQLCAVSTCVLPPYGQFGLWRWLVPLQGQSGICVVLVPPVLLCNHIFLRKWNKVCFHDDAHSYPAVMSSRSISLQHMIRWRSVAGSLCLTAEYLCLFPVPDNSSMQRGCPPGPAGGHQSRARRGQTLWKRPERREAPDPRLPHPVVYQLSAAAQRPVLLLTRLQRTNLKKKIFSFFIFFSGGKKNHLRGVCRTRNFLLRWKANSSLELMCWLTQIFIFSLRSKLM